MLCGGALLGKIAGFIRELIFARLLGASFIADSYRGAVTASLLPVMPLQADMVFCVLIPLHRQWKVEGRAAQLFTPLIVLFGLISSLIALMVCVFADDWVGFIVPGFDPAAHAVTTLLVRVMALGVPASVMTACLSCIEISVGRSRITTLRALVQNIVTIVGVLALAATARPITLALSFTSGFWILLLVGGYLLWKEDEIAFRYIRLTNGIEAARIFVKRTRPLFAQPVLDQLNTLIERFAGSNLGVGSIAALEYSRTLTDTAQYLVGYPIGYVMLAQEALTGAQARARVETIARPLLAVAMPISLYIVIFSPEMVQIIYQRGAFDAHAVTLTAGALRGIGCGLWAAVLGYILLRMLSASARNGIVVCVVAAGSMVNILINFLATPLFGTFGLGLGETARGVAILVCVSFALGCSRMILQLVLNLIPALVVVGAVSYGIRGMMLPMLPSLVLAGAAVGVVALFGVRPELVILLRRIWPRPA